MIRLIPALTIAMIALCIANLIASVQAEVVIQSEAEPPKTNFSASPITAGFWQFSNKKNANINEISKGCREYVTLQFQDGYYWGRGRKSYRSHSVLLRPAVVLRCDGRSLITDSLFLAAAGDGAYGHRI